MTLEDAAKAVMGWLTRQPIAFLNRYSGGEYEPHHFMISIAQLAPEQRQRIFEVVPTGVADCYEVRELEAA